MMTAAAHHVTPPPAGEPLGMLVRDHRWSTLPPEGRVAAPSRRPPARQGPHPGEMTGGREGGGGNDHDHTTLLVATGRHPSSA
jgi:hypothetical protein